ncbi:hypothetical protein JOE58_002330 [Curtobacterium luteum]|uniref:Uncharacterized protein n=1 Tax=Curtobacterium luteum TaxID=33881 RepID=A0A8H9G874_9MICO|nr:MULTISPECIES: hypothetical protein [Curtobacterium]MBM7803079.1 hypothetical protein [Curtobacterium luteum]NUU50731.1 hypothetical protein [Curtobacterium luteum]GGK93819.1 hypothetical protein GCM10009769_09880 [Curtobacterium luteum]
MTDQDHGGGWGAVPPVDVIRGTTAATARPPRKRMRRGPLVAIVAGVAALVLLVVGGGIGYANGMSTHAADRPVRAFLDDLAAGRASAALAAAGIEHDASDVLLTDAAYAKAKRTVTGYRVAAVRTSGDSASVTAYLRQGGQDVSAVFDLTRTGTDWGVFPVWQLQPPRLGTVDVSVRGPSRTPLRVAGKSVTTSKGGTASLSALPGTYDVAVRGGEWVRSDSASATVSGFGGTASSPVALTASLTSAGERAATKAVDAWVDGCIASHDPAPSGCSFYAYGEDPSYTYTNERWTLGTRPVVSVGAWSSEGWLVTTTTYGRATFSADISGPGGVGTATAGPMNVNASGYITGIGADGATFRSAVAPVSSESGS